MLLFLLAFIGGVLLVVFATVGKQHLLAVTGGGAVIVLHLMLTWPDGHDEEAADTSYFLGFLLTLALLAAGLWKLVSSGTEVAGQQAKQVLDVLPFVQDLAAGFALTIIGLAARQVRVLAMSRLSTSNEDGLRQQIAMLLQAQQQLVGSIERLACQMDRTEIGETMQQADLALTSTRESLEQLQRSMTEAATKIGRAAGKFGDVVEVQTTQLAERATALTSTLQGQVELVESNVTHVMTRIGEHRQAIEDGLVESLATTQETQRKLADDLRLLREEWQQELLRTSSQLKDLHETLSENGRRGLTNIGHSADSFTTLTEQVRDMIVRMPDPSAPVVQLWTNIQQLDAALAATARAASGELGTLGEQAREATASVSDLSRATRSVAVSIEGSGTEGATVLRRELAQVSKVIDDFLTILEKRVGAMAVR